MWALVANNPKPGRWLLGCQGLRPGDGHPGPGKVTQAWERKQLDLCVLPTQFETKCNRPKVRVPNSTV